MTMTKTNPLLDDVIGALSAASRDAALLEADPAPAAEPEAVAGLIAVCQDLACALESYSDDHNSPRPTDVTVLLPALREALANVEGVTSE